LRRFILENHAYHTISKTLDRRPIFAEPAMAEVVVAALEFLRQDQAFVIAYAVMPDHLHALLVPKTPRTIPEVMQSLKGYVAREVNRASGTQGPLWQRSYYDRVIRDEKQLGDTIRYIEANPVSEGLVSEAQAYPFSSAYQGIELDLATWTR
jgi:REP element-mobilizing transposase RayT